MGGIVGVCACEHCGRTELAAPVGRARGEHDQRGDGGEVDDAALCHE